MRRRSRAYERRTALVDVRPASQTDHARKRAECGREAKGRRESEQLLQRFATSECNSSGRRVRGAGLRGRVAGTPRAGAGARAQPTERQARLSAIGIFFLLLKIRKMNGDAFLCGVLLK